jgi:(p)ppGpp synthase/HD superfamily hydrolase
MLENKATFFARLESRLSPSELTVIRGAYYLAKYGHRAQLRQERDAVTGKQLRYFEHVRRVALILMDEASCFEPSLICAALLHDSIEDTDDINAEIIELFFGRGVAQYVQLLTKTTDKLGQPSYIDKLFSAPWQVVLIKACDRLDNLRSLHECPKAFQEKQIKETREKYLPLFGQHADDVKNQQDSVFD